MKKDAQLAFFLLSVSVSEFSFGEEFGQTVECKLPNFNSYHVAQMAERHIKKAYPELAGKGSLRPNYLKKYYLFKQELVAENLWLMVDCHTGLFVKDHLKGELSFNEKDPAVTRTEPKGNKPPEFLVWSGTEWTQVESPAPVADQKVDAKLSASPAPEVAKSPPKKSADQLDYSAIFRAWPAEVGAATCKPLRFNDFFRAQQGQKNIESLNPDRSKPNFAGGYLLVKHQVLFETLWYLADCSNGVFSSLFLKGNIEFKPDSRLVVVKKSGEFAQLEVWHQGRWVQVMNPHRQGAQEIENWAYDQEALVIAQAFEKLKDGSKFTFQDLMCDRHRCNGVLFPKKESSPLVATAEPEVRKLVQLYGRVTPNADGALFRIDEGMCQPRTQGWECQLKLRQK